MLRRNQTGAISGVGLSLVLTILALIGVTVFAVWAFMGRQDYKDHTDAKIKTAVTVAKQQESTAKDAAFAEAEKNPLKDYNGPEAFGSIALQYPKTWSGYIKNDGGSNSSGLDVYFYPSMVPPVDNAASVFALRLQVISQPYAQTVKNAASTNPKSPSAITPYALPKVPRVVGVKVDGGLRVAGSDGKKTGSMVILPLRSQTIEIWTEGNQFLGDFNNIILPNFSFSP